ncbi:MAG: HzsA-related protein [Polyangiales bacterium]
MALSLRARKVFSGSRLPLAGIAFGVIASIAGAGSQGCGKRDGGGSDVIGDVPAVVFAKRANYDRAGKPVVADGTSQVIDYLRYVPGGGVYTLTPPRPDGTLENITAAFPNADVNGLDVSFDAKQVVFSMKTSDADNYHIYLADVAGGPNNTHNIRQLTFGKSRDDVMPIFVPGDRIAFVTNQPYTPMGTRADEYEHAAVVSQIATISNTGGDADRKVCAQNLSHTVNLFLRSDGTIGFSRWEHLGNTNDVKLFKVNPDCTQMLPLAGQGHAGKDGKPMNSIVQVSELSPGVMVGIGTQRNRTLHSGALFRIDVRAQQPGASSPDDEENVIWENLTPGVPVNGSSSPLGRYRTPSHLPDGRILVSWAQGEVNDTNELAAVPPNFGVYVYDESAKQNILVYDDPQFSELYAAPVVSKSAPPLIYDVNKKHDVAEGTTIGSIDVTQTSLKESINGAQFTNTDLGEALKQAVAVRIIEGFSSEIGSTPMFGLTMHEGAAVLGEVPVQKDGSWGAKIPSYIPVHLQPIDKFGMSIRSQGLWIQGMPGEARTCGGCHESRTALVTPRRGPGLTIAQQMGPTDVRKPIKDREEFGWDKVLQPILDAKCVSCHGPDSALAKKTYKIQYTDRDTGKMTEYEIPWLDLTGATMTVPYDMGIYTFSRSYVSLYYPAQLRMGMTRGIKVIGELPPAWMVPADARNSQMIQDLNPKADDGELAWKGKPQHDVDKGAALTVQEIRAFIKSADLGGQWVSRQNVKSASCWKSDAADKGTCGNGAGAAGADVYPTK